MAGRVTVGQPFRISGPPARVRPEPRMPGLVAQLGNLVASAATVAAAAVRGERVLATGPEADRRHAICRENRCGFYRADVDRCANCGCWMGFKAWAAALKCPVGWW